MAIYKDNKRGTWYVSVYVELSNGDRKRIMKRGFKTKREAKQAESEIIFNATIENPDNPLFSDVIDEYVNWYEKRRKKTSLDRLKTDVRLYLKPFFKNKHIQDVSKRDAMKYQEWLLDKLSVKSSKSSYGYFSSVLKHGIKMEYITVNVASEVGGIIARENKKFNYWTLEEFKKYLSVINDLKYQTIFMMLFYSGVRIGELLALTWGDIDFNKNAVDINKRVYEGEIDTTKTLSSKRKVILPNHTMDLLREYKPKNVKDTYFIFGTVHDPLSRTTVVTRHRKYLSDSGVTKIRLHDFRHSHASYLINRGYDIQIVSKRLGHAKVSITYDIYAHLYPNKEQEAIDMMENDFAPADVVDIRNYR